eukprot:scaffold9305_cov179-Ochromonas_danica.AAC.3
MSNNASSSITLGAPICSHHDPSRQTVSVTAHGVAYSRGMESTFHPYNPLFHDPYALKLGGEIGQGWVNSSDHGWQSEEEKQSFHNTIAVRTRKIDDSLDSILANHPQIKQI